MSLGCIERTRKVSRKSSEHIDVGSLRSGRDAICDVDLDSLSEEQLAAFKTAKRSGKDLIARRSDFNLEDRPLLLVYRIKKDGGTPRSHAREKMNSQEDIIGISIIVPGDSIGASHARTLRVKLASE